MPSSHSWHEVKTVLLAIGYRQTITRDERLIYVSGEDRIVLQKSNKLDITYLAILCDHLGIKYIDFLKIYQREYDRIAKERKKTKGDSTVTKD